MKAVLRTLIFCGCLLLSTTSSFARDTHPVSKLPGTKTRSSPFDPPTKDAFVADDGPGLDTGCTFNTDPENPLTIQIMVDRAVGPVDGDGHLINPDPLIAAGIVPATVDILLPAFDVDVNGGPPPERDQVLFNGTKLGFLQGDNEIWLLNSFQVDIRQIKFPAPPPAGGTAVPVANTLQVNIDVLSQGTWCTSIDWVALIIPIHPKLALTLEATSSNPILKDDRSGLITTIYKQSFDAGCSTVNDIDNFDQYPFSGSSPYFFGFFGGQAVLHAKIATCPEGSIPPPHVVVDWNVAGTALQGTEDWTSLEGDISIDMPDAIGTYTTQLTFTVNDEPPITVQRKLFVTKDSPLASVSPPLLTYYDKATSFASGQSSEDDILKALLAGTYGYGTANWKYHYVGLGTCPWDQLLAPLPLSCDYGDCYRFSEAFEELAATLGVGGLAAEKVTGSHGFGFVTSGAPSLDPVFRGNTELNGAGVFDHYFFSSHSLRSRGFFFTDYYDATFNGIYSSPTAFISYNLIPGQQIDLLSGQPYFRTDEGARFYPISPPLPPPYDVWGGGNVVTAGPGPNAGSPAPGTSAAGLSFSGATFETVDDNGDGVADALLAHVQVQVLTAGTYIVSGTLRYGTTLVASRPQSQSMLDTHATVSGGVGSHVVDLRFSGEEIFQAGLDGPWSLDLLGGGSSGWTTSTLTTPAYPAAGFGESPVGITAASDEGVDTDGNGIFDNVGVSASIRVRTSGHYRVQVTFDKNGRTLGQAASEADFSPGAQTVSLQIPGQRLRRAAIDGPYSVVVEVTDAAGRRLADRRFASQSYTAATFDVPLTLDASSTDQGVDLNGNGLFDVLRFSLKSKVTRSGSYRLSARLRPAAAHGEVLAEHDYSFAAGDQTVTFDVPGYLIRTQGVDGPYTAAFVVRSLPSGLVVDAVDYPHATGGYAHTSFDPFGAGAIALTGTVADEGIDTNGNGRFDVLRVTLDVALGRNDFYTWSARLEDAQQHQIDFQSQSGFVSAGIQHISLFFDGAKIGANGKNGPYQVRGLLMYGSGGANLVAPDAGATRAWNFRQFEGATSNRPPVAAAGPDVTVECAGPRGTSVRLDGRASSDPDGDPLTFRWSATGITFDDSTSSTPSGTFQLGSTQVILHVSEGQAQGADTVVVTVQDATAPTLSVSLTPAQLWPPNHTMQTVTAHITAVDGCDPHPTLRLASISCSEGGEAANISGAMFGAPDTVFQLRAERSGTGTGRVYTVCYEAEDHSGHISRVCKEVLVPHDQVVAAANQRDLDSQAAVSAIFWAKGVSDPDHPSIQFNLPAPGLAQLRLFDLSGRQLAMPLSGFSGAGVHQVDLREVRDATGTQMCFYRLDWQGRSALGKIVLVR